MVEDYVLDYFTTALRGTWYEIMASDQFLHCPILNFISRCMYAGVKTDKFAKSSVEFFPKKTILEGKKLLYEVMAVMIDA